MARQPEVFVRELDPAEAQRLVKITRTARDRVRLRRAGIVLSQTTAGSSVNQSSAADQQAQEDQSAALTQHACPTTQE
jgi:hypothetical protein